MAAKGLLAMQLYDLARESHALIDPLCENIAWSIVQRQGASAPSSVPISPV